jgi:hypothetical protein
MINDKGSLNNRLLKPDESEKMVTIALPAEVVRLLETVDEDPVQAIVKLAGTGVPRGLIEGSSYEIVEVAPQKSVIIVGSETRLSRIPWLKLVEIAPGRNLIAIPSGTSLESLEISILDLIEHMPSDDLSERTLLEDFRKYVGRLRRNRKMSKFEILIVDSYDEIGHSS